LKGITQTQVEPDRGYTFSSGLRAILRQDPDIILIGEIRDKETAQIAVQAALTGHLVLSTLHTNDAAGAIPRMIDIKTNPSSFAAALNIIIAQRLVRRLCDKCKKEINIPNEILLETQKFTKIDKKQKIYQAQGCKHCHQGYKGRIGIFEMIPIDEEMEKLINNSPGRIEVLEKTRQKGMMNFYQDGLLKVLQGITTLEEIQRIAGEN